MLIETTGTEKSREELEKSEVIQESGITRYSTYSKRKPRRSCWSSVETLQFYKALSTIGPDFTLMTQLFPKRDRHDLKLKFKKEDKLNRELVDKAMTGHVDFDFNRLQEEIKQENEEIEMKRIEMERYEKQKIEERQKVIAQRKQTASIKKEYNKTPRRRKRKIPCSQELADTDDSTTDEEAKKCQEVAQAKRASIRRPELRKLKESVKESVPKPKTERGSTKAEASGVKKSSGKSRTLNEFHEMNETLKKDLCSQPEIKKIPDSGSDDRYTPNGLFESPKLTEDDGRLVWTIDVSSVPPIEETVLRGNDNSDMEAVSEISGLGSFGQDSNSALDLSATALDRRPFLDRRIITESMEIMGQLTSHVEDKEPLQIEKVLPLPSFETVIGMRSPFRHLVEAADYLESTTLPEESRVEFRTNTDADRLGVTVGADQSEGIPEGFRLSEMISQSEKIIPEMIPQSENIIPDDSEQSGMIPEESELSEIIPGGSEYSDQIPGGRETSVIIPGGSENSGTVPTGSEHIEIITRSREQCEMILGD